MSAILSATDGLGSLRTFVLRSDEERTPVLPWLSAARDENALYIVLHVHDSVAVRHDGDEVVLKPDDMGFCDAGLCDSPRFGDQFRMTVFRVPRRRLDVADSDLRRVMGVPLGCEEGTGALVSGFLSALASQTAFHRTHIGYRIARNAVDLLAALVTEFVEGEQANSSGIGAQTPSRIRAFIELHLTDPDLSPESIVLAHHISVRCLHKLFQSEGTAARQHGSESVDTPASARGLPIRTQSGTGSQARGGRRGTPVGFHQRVTFSRVFRAAYGMSPSEWQASVWDAPDASVSGTVGPSAASNAWLTSGAVPSTSSPRALSS